MTSRSSRATACVLTAFAMLAANPAARAQSVNIYNLSDVAFGTISSVAANQTVAQTLCVYSSVTNYTVRATGSGTSGAFTLSNGTAQLAYTVQWAAAAGQTSGTLLTAGVGQRFTPGGLNILCSLSGLLAGQASLIVTLPAANLSTAQAGNYTGTLSLMVSPN